ncbi:MAG: winged helix-turn-helix transcriptional regulator [Candidatus Bathyarchaeia archaeon]
MDSRQKVRAGGSDRRFVILYAIQGGAKRFNEIWFDGEVRDMVHSRVTLSRYLKALEKEGVIKRNRVSHKHVEYEIAAGEQSSWILAAHELDYHPFDIDLFQLILSKIRDKASGLDIALNYAFSRFFEEEINDATAKIMGGMPQYRTALTETMELKHVTREKMNEDWSDDMIMWRSRRYYMFLKNLRSILLKQPEHVKTYLKERPWLRRPKEKNNSNLALIEKVLAEKYPHTPGGLELKHALTQKEKS